MLQRKDDVKENIREVFFSDWKENMKGVPQSSVLSSLSFNIFSDDTFLFISKRKPGNYPDGNRCSVKHGNRCSVKKVLLEILQNSDCDKCFLVNFSKFLRTPFVTEYRWLFLHNIK